MPFFVRRELVAYTPYFMHFFIEIVLSTPNPVTNILNIQAETISNDIRVTLTNALGQEIYLEMNNNQLDFSNLATGYTL